MCGFWKAPIVPSLRTLDKCRHWASHREKFFRPLHTGAIAVCVLQEQADESGYSGYSTLEEITTIK